MTISFIINNNLINFRIIVKCDIHNERANEEHQLLIVDNILIKFLLTGC